MGWRDWRAWDRLDRLDRKVGIRNDRAPEEEEAIARKGSMILYGVMVGIALLLAIFGRWFEVLLVLVIVGIQVWVRRPMKF